MIRQNLLVVIGLTLPVLNLAADPPSKKPTKPDAKPATQKVEKGVFKVELNLKGYFDSPEAVELSLRPEAWTPEIHASLVVMKALDAGTRVKKGDPVLWFDLEKIDQMIRDLENERSISELALRLSEEEIPVAERTTPVDLAAAERTKRLADEDLKKFLEVDRPLAEKSAEFSVKNARHGLEYAQEELKQLEKMYRAGDVREETEEIVLRRQRNAVENAQFNLKTSEIRRDQVLKVELPRQEQSLRENAVKQSIGLDKARGELPLQLNQKRVGLEKAKYEHTKLEDKIRKLKRDRAIMTVRAPMAGIVYYGKGTRGQWNIAAIESRLARGGVFTPDEVFMTIVADRPLFVRATVEEKDVHDVQPGLAAKIVPASDPERRLAGKVEKLLTVPSSPGNFDARLSVDLGADNTAILPGMACTAKVRPYLNENALTVPAKAVFAEEADEDSHYVYVLTSAGKPEKRTVKTGRTASDKTEITSSLKEGEEVLLEKPKNKEPGK
jgi:multidrug efflux pump subunit AcrA (membrane-fusion protein)